jgi:hypothetical protein
MRPLYKKVVEAMWEVEGNFPSVPMFPRTVGRKCAATESDGHPPFGMPTKSAFWERLDALRLSENQLPGD